MNVCIYYFSGTGNTWWAANNLVEKLQNKGMDCQCYSIEDISKEEVDEINSKADIIGIGYPIYGSDLPRNMQSFISNILPEGKDNSKKAFVFCTQLFFSGDGALVGARMLKEKGYNPMWAYHINMPNNISVKMSPLPYTNKAEKIKKILNRADKRISKLSMYILNNRKRVMGKNPIISIWGIIQRVSFRKYYDKWQDFGIDKERCTTCGLCVANCPVKNIKIIDGKIIFGNECVYCLRCYNFCPNIAVTYMGKSHDKDKEKPYQGPNKDWLKKMYWSS